MVEAAIPYMVSVAAIASVGLRGAANGYQPPPPVRRTPAPAALASISQVEPHPQVALRVAYYLSTRTKC